MDLSPEQSTEVYNVARSLLPAAKSYAKRYSQNYAGGDSAEAEDILMEATHKVIENLQNKSTNIDNLPAYLFGTYKYLLLARFKRSHREQSLNDEQLETITSGNTDIYQELEQKILIEEIAARFDPRARFIFDHLVRDYSYEEIAEKYSEKFKTPIKPNALRSLYSKAIRKITEQLSPETQK